MTNQKIIPGRSANATLKLTIIVDTWVSDHYGDPRAECRSSKEISTMTAPDSVPLHALAEENLAWGCPRWRGRVPAGPCGAWRGVSWPEFFFWPVPGSVPAGSSMRVCPSWSAVSSPLWPVPLRVFFC
ncbi:hypothetical protein [Streptomyces sp. TE5632]